jgi:hypothetical protein
MKMYCAYTTELDDGDIAVSEILEQLNLKDNMCKNSIGMIAMFSEFYDTGVYHAIAEALPFPCIGYTSSFLSSNGETGDLMLSVTMLTSDENEFGVFKSPIVNTLKDPAGAKAAVNQLAADIYKIGQPTLVLTQAPLTPDLSMDDMVTLLDEALNHTPLFGSAVFSTGGGSKPAFTCLGSGEKQMIEMVLVAVYGPLKPHFKVVTAVSDSALLSSPAKVTRAQSNVLYEVNNTPAVEYLYKIGAMTNSENAETMWILPTLVENLELGTQKSRAFMGFAPHDRSAIYAAGNVDVGAMISFSQLDAKTTNETALQAFKELIEEDADCFLGVSCMARSVANGGDYMRELLTIGELYKETKASKGKDIEYQIISAAGEVCPIPDKSGNLVNALHNYSLVICYFMKD